MYSLICILVAKDSTLCEFTIQKNSTIYIFGEKPFPEKGCIDWDFISPSNELIEDAKLKWRHKHSLQLKEMIRNLYRIHKNKT